MTRTVYITGFEPFGGETSNASWEAVRLLPDALCGWNVKKERLPVLYGLAADRALRTAESADPGVIVCTGVAAGRTEITPEMIAVNLRAASIPDNSGAKAIFEPIDRVGPDGIFSTLPVREMAEAVRRAGLPARVSFSAGTFVCNDLFYLMARRFRNGGPLCGFIHVPPVGVLDPESCSKGLALCIMTAVRKAEEQTQNGQSSV